MISWLEENDKKKKKRRKKNKPESDEILLIAMLIDIAPTEQNSMGFISIQFYIE